MSGVVAEETERSPPSEASASNEKKSFTEEEQTIIETVSAVISVHVQFTWSI